MPFNLIGFTDLKRYKEILFEVTGKGTITSEGEKRQFVVLEEIGPGAGSPINEAVLVPHEVHIYNRLKLTCQSQAGEFTLTTWMEVGGQVLQSLTYLGKDGECHLVAE